MSQRSGLAEAEVSDGWARVWLGRDADSYGLFIRAKALPRFRLRGRVMEFPSEYLHSLGLTPPLAESSAYSPLRGLFDYQGAIAGIAVRKRRFAVFAGCGLGKTLILLEYARHAASMLWPRRCFLIVAPLNVVPQILQEAGRFYGHGHGMRQVRAKELPRFLASPDSPIGVTNYEAITEGLDRGRLGGLGLDESSMLKSHYGAWGMRLIGLGAGLDWKICLTGTPAPNDRIEYANHAVFLDQCPTVNAFLARYFVNKGQTGERWELKPHALRAFYRDLSHWSIFVDCPSTYGWKDNVHTIPPIRVHVHDVPLTEEQEAVLGRAGGILGGGASPGGMVKRGKLAQIAKGSHEGRAIATAKPGFIRDLIASWSATESTIAWCRFNAEQDGLAAMLPGCASIAGTTDEDERQLVIRSFQDGDVRTLVSKPRILGFGMNLQIATRQVFSTIHDSYEEYWQAVKRSNRVGSTAPLDVHLPVTEIERPMMETVLAKADRVAADTKEQEALFKENRPSWL